MIGIDAVDIERLRGLLARVPAAEARLFTDRERTYCRGHADPVLHFAGTLATKEAVIKAAALGPLMSWCRRIEVDRAASGAPVVAITGAPGRDVSVSLSHDGGLAVAVAMVHGTTPKPGTAGGLVPNAQLSNYLRPVFG